jgi:hypothetical protein
MQYVAWPLVVLIAIIVFLVMFRGNIAGLIDKIRKVERTGISMEAEQAQAGPVAAKASGFQELMDSANSPVLRRQETTLRETLKAKSISDQESITILIRAVAVFSLSLRWEQIDRLIFGSQLTALVATNANSLGLSFPQIKTFYDVAAQQSPAVYENFQFEQWLQFLETHQLISKGGNGVQITMDGKEFMAWLVHAGRTHLHPN